MPIRKRCPLPAPKKKRSISEGFLRRTADTSKPPPLQRADWKEILLRIPGAHFVRDALSTPVRFIRSVCLTIGAGVLAFSAITGLLLLQFFHSLPPVESMTFDQIKAVGISKTLERLENKRAYYKWIPIKEINRALIYSVVSSEDATFFDHDGINIEAILDSLAENIRDRKTSYGASTISQQVVKNLFFSMEKSWIRKAKEFFVTRSLEQRFKKNEILEIYLNIAEFGPDMFGVAAASHGYFGLTAESVNAAEGSFMALMLPSPKRNYYTVFENQNLTKAKRRHLDRILRGLLYEEMITEIQFRAFARYDFFAYKRTGRSRVPPSRTVSAERTARRRR